jgi:hypothetical protein
MGDCSGVIKRTHHLQRCDYSICSIESSSIQDGVEVRPDEDGWSRLCSGSLSGHGANVVDTHRHARLLHEVAQEVSCGAVFVREGEAADAAPWAGADTGKLGVAGEKSLDIDAHDAAIPLLDVRPAAHAAERRNLIVSAR